MKQDYAIGFRDHRGSLHRSWSPRKAEAVRTARVLAEHFPLVAVIGETDNTFCFESNPGAGRDLF